MKIAIYIVLSIIVFPFQCKAQLIDWATETGLTPPSEFIDGQVITDFAETGLNVRINVDLVSAHPRIPASSSNRVITGGVRTDCRFTLTILNGTASIRIDNYQNLQRGERITLSNSDGEAITIQQTSNNGGARMQVDGTTVPALSTDVIQDDTAVVREANNGAGTQWFAIMNSITSFTWEYDAVPGTSATEGFTLTLLSFVLPIELVHFSAQTTAADEVVLNWKTASEINNDYFMIERSRNGLDWQEVTRVKGAGNSSSLITYSVTDNNPYSGISYYRLKQTDFDGKYDYSEVKSVNIGVQKNSTVLIYPNPSNDIIRITGDESEIEYLKLYNSLGQEINPNTFQILPETSTLKIVELSSLDDGLYLLKTKTTVNKVYKQ